MNYLLVLILLYGLPEGLLANSVDFNDCGSLYYLDDVIVEGCSSLPCVFTKGQSYNITFKLTAGFDSEDLEQYAIFQYSGLRYGMVVDPETLCDNMLSCPLTSGQNVTFTSTLKINSTLPLSSMTGELYWTTTNENSEEVVCMQTQVTLSES